jgi:hypothetical protein
VEQQAAIPVKRRPVSLKDEKVWCESPNLLVPGCCSESPRKKTPCATDLKLRWWKARQSRHLLRWLMKLCAHKSMHPQVNRH